MGPAGDQGGGGALVSIRMGIPVWDRLKGSPMKIIQASCMAALTLCLAGVALADDLQSVGDFGQSRLFRAAVGAHHLLV